MIRATVNQLTRPLDYLRIVGSGKRAIDVYAPLVLMAITASVLLWLQAPITTEKGLFGQINNLLQMLVGFYVASLAAVATFPNAALDQNVRNARLNGVDLTRRRLLSLLFGYLAFLSLFLYLLGALGMLIAKPLHVLAIAYPWVRAGLVSAYTFALWNLLCVTMLGLYYLVDKIYQADPIVYPRNEVQSPTAAGSEEASKHE